jgi:Fe-S-cluster containining protein
MKPIAELHEKVDALNAKLVAETARLGRPITCQGKGCCACCYEPVYCSDAEARHLLEGLTEDQKADVADRVDRAIGRVKTYGLFESDMPPVMQWLAMKLPCPLLENGLCTAYQNRPVSCRSHFAVNPAEGCATNRLEQRYPGDHGISKAIGQAVVEAHLKLGNTIIHDNLLALLENELLGEYHPTASAEKIVFEEVDNPDKTQ